MLCTADTPREGKTYASEDRAEYMAGLRELLKSISTGSG
jgi:hypothetical protein